MRQAWHYCQEKSENATVHLGVIAVACGGFFLLFLSVSKFVDFAVRPFDSRTPGLGTLLIVAAAFTLMLASLDWRGGVWLLMFWLVIGDIIRRLLPGQPPQLMLVADLIVGGIYIGYFIETIILQRRPLVRWPGGFLGSLLLFAMVSVLGMFNPSLPSFWYGFVGLHSYAWFLPLVFVGSTFSQDSRPSLNLIQVVSALCIPLFFLALYQYFHFGTLPAALQSLHGDLDYHSFHNDAIPLISSAFGNAEKYARYCCFGAFLSMAMLGDLQLSIKRRALALLSAVTALGGIFVSDRRAPLYLCLVGLTFVMWKMRYVFRGGMFWAFLLLVLVIGVFAHSSRSEKIADSSEYFASSVPIIGDRVSFFFDEIDVVSREAGIFGHGTGADSQGIDYVPGGAMLLTRQGAWIENGLPKVWWELGPFGLASFLFFWGAGAALLCKKVAHVGKSRSHSYVLCYVTYFCIMFVWFAKGHQIMGDVATGIDQWLFFGIIAGLPMLPKAKSLPNQVRREATRSAFTRCAS